MLSNTTFDYFSFDGFSKLKTMEVGDNNLGLFEIFPEFCRDEIVLAVIVFRVVRKQDAQPIPNRDPGGYD